MWNLFVYLLSLCCERGMFVILSPAWVKQKKNLLFVAPKDHAPDCVQFTLVNTAEVNSAFYMH